MSLKLGRLRRLPQDTTVRRDNLHVMFRGVADARLFGRCGTTALERSPRVEVAMKQLSWWLGVWMALWCVACSSSTTRVGDGGSPNLKASRDHHLALSELPAAVTSAAIAAVPGLVIESAEQEMEDGVAIYSLEGMANGKAYCVEVSLDGKVLQVEDDDDDDDDDEDED